jgi:hypothetical protein
MEMLSAHQRNRLANVGLSILVALLLLDVTIMAPLEELGVVSRHIAEAALMLILLAGVAAVSWRNAVVRLFMLAALGNIVVGLANLVLPDATLRLTDTLLTITGFALLAALVLWQVFLPGRVDLYRILGAIAAYLLIGLLFAQVFRPVRPMGPGCVSRPRGAARLRHDRAAVPLLQLRHAHDARLRRSQPGPSSRALDDRARGADRRALPGRPDRTSGIVGAARAASCRMSEGSRWHQLMR